MFGYVMPVKDELKVKDYEAYRAHYCGLCKQLKKEYGNVSRFLLNYDMVLLSVIADALSGNCGILKTEGCFVNPLMKRCMCHNTNGLELGADSLVMLTYHKLCDDVLDEKFIKKAGYKLLRLHFKRKYKKAAKRHPEIDTLLTNCMQRQSELENNNCQSLDEICEPTAKMCEALFRAAATNDSEKRILSRLGLYAGQIVYLLDAAEDFDDDEKNGSYNVFIRCGMNKQQAIDAAKARCRMAAGEIALAYNLLHIKQYKDILDNIIFLGIPTGISMAGMKRNKRSSKHGQIQSV